MPENPILDELTKDFERLRAQKSRPSGGVEGRVLLNLCFVNTEQHVKYQDRTLSAEPKDQNKLYLTFDLISPRCGKLIGRLSAGEGKTVVSPDKKDPEAQADAEVIEALDRALDNELDEASRRRERYFWMMVGGVAFEYVPWVKNRAVEPVVKRDEETQEPIYRNSSTGEEAPESTVAQLVEMQATIPEQWELVEELAMTGQVGSEIYGPLNVFLDQGVKSIDDLAPDQWVHIAQPRTKGWVKEQFELDEVEAKPDFTLVTSKFVQANEQSTGGVFLADLIPLIQGSSNAQEENAPVLVVEAFSPASKANPRGRYVCYIPGQQVLHEGENIYGRIPVVDFHWKPVTTSFWNQDYVSPLIPPQRFINKRVSQLGEQSNASIYSQLLLPPGKTMADIPADWPGGILDGMSPEGVPLVGRLPAPELPSWFMASIELATKMFNDVAGGADLFQEQKFPGQLRGPLAVPMLQEILDTEWGPLFNHMSKQLSKVKQMRMDRVQQFYPPSRTLHYTSRDQKEEVLQFHKKVLEGGTKFNISIESGSMMPELRALKEQRLIERLQGPLSILYMDERTGRWDTSKIAADLQFGDRGRASREAQYRKLGSEIVDLLWQGKPAPQVLPFWDHTVMLDELEAAMSTMEYVHSSPQIQQGFMQQYEQHRGFLQQEAQQQQMAMQNGMIQNAVAQATQQSAAKAAAEAVDMAIEQMRAQNQQPTGAYVQQAFQERGQQPPQKPPQKRERSVTIKEREQEDTNASRPRGPVQS
jgi:hypothetical protein